MTLIKVCGITNIEDAQACAELGADMLGFIFAESPRRVDIDTAAEIIEVVRNDGWRSPNRHPKAKEGSPNPNSPKLVGVFTEENTEIPTIAEACGLDLIQLHGTQSDAFASAIGKDRVIRVTRVKNEFSIDALTDYPSAAYYLLDTYKKGQAGGTGETFDWSLAILARSLLKKPVILSGGLNPANVYHAVRAVRPYAVDVSSGVELTPGRKDIAKVKEFIDHVREADSAAR